MTRDHDQPATGQPAAEGQEPTDRHDPTLLGWAARIISVALLLLLSAVLVTEMVREKDPVSFGVSVARPDVRQDNGQWLIPVDVTNRGSRTAQAIVLEITAGDTDTEVDIDMLGAREQRRVVIGATTPVGTVTHKVVSFETP